jgi:adenosylhomocysteine nucleosidase
MTSPVPHEDTAHCDIGLVCALPMEVGPFLARCDKVKKYTGGAFTFRGGKLAHLRVAVVESGAGPTRARKATLALIDAHTPRWVLSIGFSGALRPEMQVGHIVMADAVVDPDGQTLKLDLNMPADPARGLYVGPIVTERYIVRTVAEKQALAEKSGAIAVDLESSAVAAVCREAHVRFLAVRTISDDMSADLPPEVAAIFGSTGSVRAGAVAGALWKRFSSAKDMWRLRENAAQAADKLAVFLEGVVAQLPIDARPTTES